MATLKDLCKGQQAVIEDLCGENCACQQLASLGFFAGALVRMIQPGCPCLVQVQDARVMLRGENTEMVHVSPL